MISVSKFSSVQSLNRLGRRGDMTVGSADYLPAFSAGGDCEPFWHGQGRPLVDAVHPAFPLPTMALPTLQGALKDGFEEAVVVCNVPGPCKLLIFDSCQKRFLRTHKEVDLAPHQLLVLCSK